MNTEICLTKFIVMKTRITLYIGILLFFCSCDRTQQLQKIAQETAAEFADYLPYTHNDTLFFRNNTGDVDNLRIDYNQIPSSFYADSMLNAYNVTSDGQWFSTARMYFLYGTRGYFYCKLDAMYGDSREYIYAITCKVHRYIDSKNYMNYLLTNTCKVGIVFPDSLCILGVESSSSPNGHIVLVRHKGLVEYSFDGQEIWRLVE